MMRRLCVLLTLACLLSMPAHALSVVTADYDSDRWEVQPLLTEQVEGILINECGLPEMVPSEYGGTADITKE